MKHTKGPWIADITNVFENFGETDRLHFRVARCDFDGQRNEESKANARLISCAPEMLEALIIQYEWLYSKAYYNTCESIKSVIEKATGMKIEEVLKNESR